MLLQLLRIKNLALVEDLEWEISPGFTAITGETGAGKSIIIGALQLLLGERADKSLVRTGAEMCTVEAIFQDSDFAKWNAHFEESGIEPCDPDLILKRSLSLSGTNRQFINGSPTTLGNLKELGDDLVDLHGPHDHQSLLSPDRQLDLLDAFANTHETAVVELSQIARDLSRYAENLDLDPEQLSAIEQRISLFESLKRKYGTTISEVITFGERAAERMRKIEGRDEELQRLTNEIATLEVDLRQTGERLRKLRTKAAPKLSEMVRRNLCDLGFKQSQFEARMNKTQAARASGFDAVELLFSPNPGEPLKSMRAIASSGEISRLMLAIKSALAAQDAVPLLVFDEIDANVGGEIAHAVGARMRELAKQHQVLCITHLPPVAAAATSQFVVTQEVRGGRTFTLLREVSGKARREEIARMLGGKSDEALKLAATMLDQH